MYNHHYKTEAGFHTPIETAKTIKRLIAEFPTLKFQDEAWHNDASDKITVKGTTYDKVGGSSDLCIWVPNPEEGHEYGTFGFSHHDADGNWVDEEDKNFATYEELADHLRTIVDPDAKPIKTFIVEVMKVERSKDFIRVDATSVAEAMKLAIEEAKTGRYEFDGEIDIFYDTEGVEEVKL